ncbi:MAG: hypothetical protein QOI66_1865 [Myxococcales bacterium]|nr:hypothetical protein [Myxococcales bacterium]
MARRSTAVPRRRPLDDVAVIVGRTADQEGLQIMRRRAEDQSVEVGTLRPLQEGKPIDGEVISLKPRADFPFLCDVKVELSEAEVRRPSGDGPAQVASDGYRRGWDAIWGRQPRDAITTSKTAPKAARNDTKLN